MTMIPALNDCSNIYRDWDQYMKIKKDQRKKKIGVIIEHLLFNVIFISIIAGLIGFVIVQSAYRRYYSYKLVEKSVKDTYKDIEESIYNAEKRDTPDLVDMVETMIPVLEEDEINAWLMDGVELNESILSELNIVDGSGIITHSSNPDYIGYDMHSGSQSAEFLCLLSGAQFYSQEIQEISFDNSVKMHYFGAPFKNMEGFVQIGQSSELFRKMINEDAMDTARNREVGLDGFIIICDREGNIIGSTRDLFESGTFTYMDFLPENIGEVNKAKLKFFDQDYYSAALTEKNFCIIGCYSVREAGRAGVIDVLMVLVLIFMIAVFIFNTLSRFLQREVIDGVESLNGSLSKITEGDLDEKADFRESLEFNELSDGINYTVDRLKELIKEAEKRIDTELSQAARIQASFLPRENPPFPDRKEFELFASMVPAKNVGGDFYDYFFVDEDHLALVMADVSGKGIPAAMFMAVAKTRLRQSVFKYGTYVANAMEEANTELSKDNDEMMFVTIWLGVVDLTTGHVDYVNAGHEYPAVCRAQEGFNIYEGIHGPFAAAVGGTKYTAGSFELAPGDILFQYTDGITEATDANENMFKEERMLEALNKDITASVEDIDAAVRLAVSDFVKDAPQFDDMTTLVFRYKGN